MILHSVYPVVTSSCKLTVVLVHEIRANLNLIANSVTKNRN